jgi:tRNA(Ile)-lysidine synthase
VVRRVAVGKAASLEAAARAARYAALDAVADELGLAVVLLGHTARDQAETVLLRVLRGTGPAGLAAMAARRGRYLRPLLGLPRAAIEAYAAARALPVIDDPMNRDPRLTRVRVRDTLMPRLAAENPAIEAALCRLAQASAEWLEVIDAAAVPLGVLPVDCRTLAAQPAAIRKRALTLALDRAGLGYAAAQLDRLDAVIRAPARGTVAVDLVGGRVERRWDRLEVARPAPRGPIPLVDGRFEVRGWRPGERMRPRRRAGRSRKIADLLAEARVPRADRAAARVVVRAADGVIVWAEHLGWAVGEGPPPA